MPRAWWRAMHATSGSTHAESPSCTSASMPSTSPALPAGLPRASLASRTSPATMAPPRPRARRAQRRRALPSRARASHRTAPRPLMRGRAPTTHEVRMGQATRAPMATALTDATPRETPMTTRTALVASNRLAGPAALATPMETSTRALAMVVAAALARAPLVLGLAARALATAMTFRRVAWIPVSTGMTCALALTLARIGPRPRGLAARVAETCQRRFAPTFADSLPPETAIETRAIGGVAMSRSAPGSPAFSMPSWLIPGGPSCSSRLCSSCCSSSS